MWFRHPKPFIQKAVAVQMVKRAAPACDTSSIEAAKRAQAPSDLFASELPSATATQSIECSVSYTLRDYLAVLREHVLYEVSRRNGGKTAGRFTRLTLPAWVALVGTPMYLIKRMRMPVCDFTIDHEGITRVSAAGTLRKPWQELVEARPYSRSYLLVFERGAIALPYRVLGAQKSARMRALLAQVQD